MYRLHDSLVDISDESIYRSKQIFADSILRLFPEGIFADREKSTKFSKIKRSKIFMQLGNSFTYTYQISWPFLSPIPTF